MEVKLAGQSVMTEGTTATETSAAEVTEGAEVEILIQLRVSTQLEVPLAQEEMVEVQQPGSPSVLMPTSQITKPSSSTRVLSGKAPATKASFIQVSSSLFEEHVDFS